MFEEREYQERAAEAGLRSLLNPQLKSLIALPTGAGKTVVIGKIIQKYLKLYPNNEILILSHTQEILEQDIAALDVLLPHHSIGVYSAGLKEKRKEQITVGGIQTVVKNPQVFQWVNLVIIDEAHSVSHKAQGSYRALLDATQAQILGVSATIYRTGHGFLHEGKTVLFNHVAIDLTKSKEFNKLIQDKYLSPLISVETATQLNSDEVKKTAGEYNIKQLSETHDRKDVTCAAIQDALYYGKNYKKWLVFTIDIDHCHHVAEELNRQGISARVLHSRMTADRKQTLADYREGKFKALVSVGMVTTGFDEPAVDLILMLRPTLSPVLHVQMLGRGLRISPAKKHCLVLDYAGNSNRHGLIDDIQVPRKGKKGPSRIPAKTCPECKTITHPKTKTCLSCNYEFTFKSRLEATAYRGEVMSQENKKDNSKWLRVQTVTYQRHRKVARPDTIVATYLCGLKTIKQWFLFSYPRRTGEIARHRLRARGYKGEFTCEAILKNSEQMKKPKEILVDFTGRWPEIKQSRY